MAERIFKNGHEQIVVRMDNDAGCLAKITISEGLNNVSFFRSRWPEIKAFIDTGLTKEKNNVTEQN